VLKNKIANYDSIKETLNQRGRDAKQALYELIIDKFAVPRQRYDHFMSHLNEIDGALALGAEKAKIVANAVLKRVREKAGY